MKDVRDRADARWLPSRFNLPLFRLYAALRSATAKPERRDGILLVVDRHQSALETFTVATAMYIIAIAFMTDILTRWLNPWAALAISIATIPLVLQLPMFAIGIVSRGAMNHRLNSVALIVIYTIVASYYATTAGAMRWVGIAFLGFLAANAVAAPLVWLMRGRIEALEAACGS